jgi:pantothenate kinase
VTPTDQFVIVEGMFLLFNENGFDKIQELLDICLFVDVELEECHRRLVDRKTSGGRDRADSEAHYERVDKPNIIRVLQTKHRADLILYVFVILYLTCY